MLYQELKKIEKSIEGNEYSDWGVSYYVAIDKLDSSISLDLAVKNRLLELEAIASTEININITLIEHPNKELLQLCTDWHLDERICNEILSLVDEDTKLYRFCNDSEYISRGIIGEVFRIIEKGQDRILMDYYFSD